jgi:hypothetical protein
MGVKRESLRSAWLVTWEWSGDHARVEDPVVALFNYRWPGETVRLVVEQIYSALKYSISDKFAVARNRKNTPYPAQARDIDGVPWLGEISCGNNPWLRARIVENVRLEIDTNGRRILNWDERPLVKRKH